jgi:hypothetical protein
MTEAVQLTPDVPAPPCARVSPLALGLAVGLISLTTDKRRADGRALP